MIRRRSTWIDVSMPRCPEARHLGSFVSGGARLLSRTVPSFLSLPPCLSLHRFPMAVFLLCVGAPLRSFRLVVADPRGGAHHRKYDLPTYTAVGKNNVECGIIMEDLLPSVKYSTLW